MCKKSIILRSRNKLVHKIKYNGSVVKYNIKTSSALHLYSDFLHHQRRFRVVVLRLNILKHCDIHLTVIMNLPKDRMFGLGRLIKPVQVLVVNDVNEELASSRILCTSVSHG